MEKKAQAIVIRPVEFGRLDIDIRGTAPYMQLRFSQKSFEKMREAQQAGQQARSRRTREPKDFDELYEAAFYRDETGHHGIPAASFRNAMINACRLGDLKMTLAKMSVFVVADALDAIDGTPLVHIEGEPEKTEMPARNATGVVDIRVRPMWRKWSARVRVVWDMDQFSAESVVNLLERAGLQVGVGEGRPFSRNSNGLGFGTFEVVRG